MNLKLIQINSSNLVKSNFRKSIESLQRLEKIDIDEIDDEDDIVKPSSYALATARKLLNEIFDFLKEAFPYCSSSLEPQGGIDLIWDNFLLKRRIWIEIPAEKKLEITMFYRDNNQSKLVNNVDQKTVLRVLSWLNDSQTSIDSI